MWFIIAIVILLIFISLIFFMKKSNNKIGKNKKIDKSFTNNNSLDLNNIKVASKIKETFNSSELIASTTELYKIFKSLDYKK
jgi:regulatory protein YycI of two-component signal transduction system YycFG